MNLTYTVPSGAAASTYARFRLGTVPGEVTTATVAALLTILGYSMYDTIIIFDRIRENVPLMKRASMRVIGNVSLWEVIPRSLATTFITLLPVAALYLFGGDTLKDFAFALLVGFIPGTYSSVFLASPLLAWWKEKEPRYQQLSRKIALGESGEGRKRFKRKKAEDEWDGEGEAAQVPTAAEDAPAPAQGASQRGAPQRKPSGRKSSKKRKR